MIKSQIDNALRKVLGFDIKYSKKEIINTIIKYFKRNEILETETILILTTIMNDFEDDYLFTLNEFFIIRDIFETYSNEKYSSISPLNKRNIAYKIAKKQLLGQKSFYTKEEVYEIMNSEFPDYPTYLDTNNKIDNYDRFEINKTKFIHEHIFDILTSIYSEYSNNYEIEIDMFEKILAKMHDTMIEDQRQYIHEKRSKSGNGHSLSFFSSDDEKYPEYTIFSLKYSDIKNIIEGENK